MMLYHWITLSSMIILMLFIRRNLRLKILQMLQNGLIILTIWSLMRMVNFSHDSYMYDKCDDFDFLIVNFPYLSSNFPESPAYGVFVSQLIRYVRVGSKYEDFLFRGSIPHGLHFGKSMVAIQTLFTNLTPLCHICLMSCSLTVTFDWFPVALSKSWRVPHVRQELEAGIAHSFRNTWFHSLWGVHDFTHSLCIYIVYVWICQ